MIPSVISSQVRRGIEDFLETTFPISTPLFEGIIARLLEDGNGVFRGPFISVKLPFRTGEGGREYFPQIPMAYDPYLHQERAFGRLKAGLSTVVATGTGSGKTESFLFPILDYCRAHRGEPGIKAIIIYPMNALANDQARRLAVLISGNPALKDAVTAGMYIGERDPHAAIAMEPGRVITSRDAMRLRPPDILLTNYKMLDYLLIRPRDFPLWKDNGPETLHYLVVDELHTFDGAQGTDLACLVRRLKDRLKVPARHLCCVATSATLGGGEHADELREYTSRIFHEEFDDASVVAEELLTAEEFVAGSAVAHTDLPDPSDPALDPGQLPGEEAAASGMESDGTGAIEAYGRRQAALWFGATAPAESDADWQRKLPELLKGHRFFRQLLEALGNRPQSVDVLSDALDATVPGFSELQREGKSRLLESMLALIALAREGDGPAPRPFLTTRVQLWQRELTRLAASVEPAPRLAFSDDLTEERLRRHLPVMHCRECGMTGWGGTRKEGGEPVNPDLQHFYACYFAYNPTTVFLFPYGDGEGGTAGRDAEPDAAAGRALLCGSCLELIDAADAQACPVCGDAGLLLPVNVVQPRIDDGKGHVSSSHDCPFCNGYESLTVLGSRAAPLTSIAVGELFSSRYNDHKKLLAFSDSVQDASHRAGFFGARTYRLTLRSALQQCLERQGSDVPLAELPGRFRAYWLERLGEADFVAAFLPPDLEWFEEYRQLCKHGRLPDDASLLLDVERRLHWEIVSEYGFNCRIGRTLEKTGSSIAFVPRSRMRDVADALLESLQNEIGGLRELDERTLLRFLQGMVAQAKNKGGIAHDELRAYIEDWGNAYLIGRIRHMPRFGKHSRAPMFLTRKRGTRFDTLLGGGSRNASWHEQYAVKCFGALDPLIESETAELYGRVLAALVKHGVFFEQAVGQQAVWGIDPAALMVGRDVRQLRCSVCGHRMSAHAEDAGEWDGAPCLRYNCRGGYGAEEERDDYYRRFYATGDVQRIFPREHTGLLDRDEREDLEKRFMRDIHQPADPNLLSCTPTLEMGIDIGDLSSVFLCSVPPSQAQYLQRIGRSGRSAGTAFNFTIAMARPHDLYFHEQPEEMLAGEIAPPGCFLNAPAVLERQFTAFCFDRWMLHTGGKAAIPSRLGQVLGNLAGTQRSGRFPLSLLDFIDTQRSLLLDAFIELFRDDCTPESVAYLREFVEGAGNAQPRLTYRIVEALGTMARELEELRKRIKKLTALIKEKEASTVHDANFEKELRDLTIERDSLAAITARIRNKDTFNFFTDEGLLPNYAFPESGAVLRSVIYRKNSDPDAKHKYVTEVFEYERPASSAIHEFAFDNAFYAEGRKVQIERVSMALSETEEWRFCGSCSYHEPYATGQAQRCPRCGDELWADDANRRKMLRIRQAEAVTSDRDSRSHDESEEREFHFYNRKKLVVFDSDCIAGAWKLDAPELPFGFEFLTRATFREVNFGDRGQSGETIRLAGMEVLKRAFTVCRDCGRVQRDPQKPVHAATCKQAKGATGAASMDCVFLYREFTSEAIRILLPAGTFDGSRGTIASFVAALYLGLRRRFRGSIDHLQTMLDEQPDEATGQKRNYLLLYDTVPGGTGYLKDLMARPEALMEVFRMALDALRSCDCRRDPEKDGCYRCIYAYRYSRDLPAISRNMAIDLLGRIVGAPGGLLPVATIGAIPINALLESELEIRFVEALRRSSYGDARISVKDDVVHYKPGWQVAVGSMRYAVEPQVYLGPEQGVTVPCEADFVFHPERESGGARPVAVFTDGFGYHADAPQGNLRTGLDSAQRFALQRSGKYVVWSLTWDDVATKFEKLPAVYEQLLRQGGKVLLDLLAGYDAEYRVKRLSQAHALDSFDLLLHYLAEPSVAMWRTYACIQAASMLTQRLDAEAVRHLTENLRHGDGIVTLPSAGATSAGATSAGATSAGATSAGATSAEATSAGATSAGATSAGSAPVVNAGTHIVGLDRRCYDDGAPRVSLLASLSMDDLAHRRLANVNALLRLHDDDEVNRRDDFKRAWNGALRAFNVLQFIPGMEFVTSCGIMDNEYAAIDAQQETKDAEHAIQHDARIRDLLELAHPSVRPVIVLVDAERLPLPVVGFELADRSGRVVASAELAWPSRRLTLLLPANGEQAATFEEFGWRVLKAGDDDCIERIVTALKSRT